MNLTVGLLKKLPELAHSQIKHLKTVAGQTPAEYCLNLVRRNDYESFICTLLLPNNLTSSAFAIRAFNTEIALVEDQVSDHKIGLMRIKFWEKALNDVYNGQPPNNPTCCELHRILTMKKLSKHYFKRLIEARFEKLNTSIFMNLDSLEKYAEKTLSSTYYLLLEAQGTKDIHTDHFASHLGKAHGIVNLIRSIPHNAKKKNIVLPQDMLMQHNISSESIIQGKNSKEFSDVIFKVSSRAKQHLDKALSINSQIKKEAKIIFLPSIIIDSYLKQLELVDFNIFHGKLQRQSSLLPLKLYWKSLFLSTK